jgi:photosystem II stability/assembly factor-like uncharacterized protein
MATTQAYWSLPETGFSFWHTIVRMAVLVGTSDGYHVFSSSGGRDHALTGHHVDALAPGPAGTWVAIVDHRAVWRHGADGAWAELAHGEHIMVSLATAHDTVFAGTADARMLRVSEGALEALPAFDNAPGREEWHQVGPPIEVRSLSATCDGKVLLANVHVGGILRSTDGGESWQPTVPVDDDIHQVCAHPEEPNVALAAAAVGLCRSHDAGATWEVEARGLQSTYSRGIAALGDTLFLSNADGPFATRSRIYTASIDGGPLALAADGLPGSVDGMVDTRGIAARNGTIAIASRTGQVWARPRGEPEWRQLADSIDGITCVEVM